MDFANRLHRLLGPDVTWSSDHEGASGAALRMTSGSSTYYVKHGPFARAEHDRLLWLSAYASVPAVVAFDDPVLVLADVGTASLHAAAPGDIGTVFGRTLRMLHSLPVESCPFDGRLPVVLARAEANVRAGAVDADDFDDDNVGQTPSAILERLVGERPSGEDLVVAHGDYTATNVLLPDVVIDVPGLGVADRYRDLAIAHRELTGAAWEDFLAAYGLVDVVDEGRLRYYRLLDELL